MGTSFNKKHMLVLSISFTHALLLCVFRVYLLFNYIEPETGFYVAGTNLGVYFNIALVVAILSIIVSVRTTRIEAHNRTSTEGGAIVFSSSLCGFLFATVLVVGAYEVFTHKNEGVFFALEVLMCIPAAYSFFNVYAKQSKENNAKNLTLALSPAVFYAIRTIHVFTDTQTQINSSQRSLTLVMLCAMMLMFVYEAYFLIPKDKEERDEKEKTSNYFKYICLTLVAMMLAIICALSYILVSVFWVYESRMLVMYILDLCIGIYAVTRALGMCKQ